MTSAISAFDKKRTSWISDDDISSDDITISSELHLNQQLVLEVSDSKTMSFGKMDTTAFFLRAKIQSMVCDDKTSSIKRRPLPLLKSHRRRRLHAPAPPPLFTGKLFPANLDEENPSTPISSALLVQADEGIPSPVVDLIDVIYRRLP
ncbi:hypothetical protein F511_12581 [Dorcoceras hygrometricum]|uniref:Uncharacterized protein n=1 Tax=Dorcoceras hygrometricum TaxID=472368 RepID=A0A2Z7A7I9_9LAMI|nr:hypothetical protein F511_12581 [Dorcoceras hygrometricum]